MSPTRESSRWTELGALVLLALAVVAVYCPWRVLNGAEVLTGADHAMLHARRMQFAQEELLGPRGELPTWYPREFLGAPFRANLQNFPLIPTRLAAFALCSPRAALTFSTVVSALLAATFTFLLARRLGLSRLAASAAGFTFACSGFYASRVLAGHTPLLEAYPALPVLAYAVERACTRVASAAPRAIDAALIGVALASMCFALAGHPQLSVYALGFATLFAWVRAPSWKRAAAVLAALGLGLGLAAFALAPMASLTGRSTRILELDAASNDLSLPYSRLPALIAPWADGWPALVPRAPQRAFEGYPNTAYFWDTIGYVGIAPLAALLLLAALIATGKLRATRIAAFFLVVGVGALLLALPWWRDIASLVPGTFLRSPSRLLYLTTLPLALGLAVAVDVLRRWRPASAPWIGVAAALALLSAHGADLSIYARNFVVTTARDAEPLNAKIAARVEELVGDGRVGIDYAMARALNRRIDDAGVFESLLLARPYRFVFETSGAPRGVNEQALDAAQLSARTLRACGVRLLWTKAERPDLERLPSPLPGDSWYRVDGAAQRAELFAPAALRFATNEELHERLRDPGQALDDVLWFDASWKAALGGAANSQAAFAPVRAQFERVTSDEILVRVDAPGHGVLRVLETFDPGWSATLDGRPLDLAPAHDTFLACAVPPGKHEVRLRYRTPGATLGSALSIASLVALALLARLLRR